jgi:hypothetical protein
MNRRSIRFRLAVWYSAVLALALVAFGAVSWIAIRHVLFHTVDETLRDRVVGVRKFMEHQIGALSVEEIRDEFKEHSVLGPFSRFATPREYGCIVRYRWKVATSQFRSRIASRLLEPAKTGLSADPSYGF